MVFYNLRNPKGSSCYKNKPNNDGTGEKDKRGSNQSWARSFQHFSEKKMTNILGVKWVKHGINKFIPPKHEKTTHCYNELLCASSYVPL